MAKDGRRDMEQSCGRRGEGSDNRAWSWVERGKGSICYRLEGRQGCRVCMKVVLEIELKIELRLSVTHLFCGEALGAEHQTQSGGELSPLTVLWSRCTWCKAGSDMLARSPCLYRSLALF